MRITVAICTWNRAELLRSTLDTMATSLVVPDGVEWELLVVDNGSRDDTDRVVAGFRDRLPVRRLVEPRQGLSHARNLAVREAAGDFLVWTDDDVRVEPGWLEAYGRAFRRWPDADLFGGPVEPWFGGPVPGWLEEAWPTVKLAYAVLDLGPEPEPLTPTRFPYGANLAVRTAAQRRYRYDPRLGHNGHGKVGGEEAAMVRALLADGGSGWWVPDARVRHWIPAERLTVGYLRAYYEGRGLRTHLEEPLPGTKPRGRAGWFLRLLAGEAVHRIGRPLGLPSPRWVRGLRAASIARGALRGSRRPPGSPGPQPAGAASVAEAAPPP
jgi:glucosyl-dolichyl phosphate glucuronosyltransferase